MEQIPPRQDGNGIVLVVFDAVACMQSIYFFHKWTEHWQKKAIRVDHSRECNQTFILLYTCASKLSSSAEINEDGDHSLLL